jgi:hypothetical protein
MQLALPCAWCFHVPCPHYSHSHIHQKYMTYHMTPTPHRTLHQTTPNSSQLSAGVCACVWSGSVRSARLVCVRVCVWLRVCAVCGFLLWLCVLSAVVVCERKRMQCTCIVHSHSPPTPTYGGITPVCSLPAFYFTVGQALAHTPPPNRGLVGATGRHASGSFSASRRSWGPILRQCTGL